MPNLFAAGQKVTAADLNDILLTARLPSDISRTSNTTLTDASGLAVPLLANSTYAIDGWVFYQANPTGDFKGGWSFPSGASGWWTMVGPVSTTAPVAGSERKNYTDFSVVSLATTLTVAGDDEFTGSVHICAVPRGLVTTGGTAGDLQFRFAQGSSTGTATIIKANSWIRVSRLA